MLNLMHSTKIIPAYKIISVLTYIATNLCITATIYVSGFTKTVLIGTRNEIQFIADY